MKIAIVDDEKYWREIAAKEVMAYYQKRKNTIRGYACGEGLLQMDVEYDIIFLDVEMDKLDGFETARKYKEKHPDCIVIMFTMHTELSRRGYIVDAFRYIDKANMSEEIREALFSVDKLLTREQKVEFNVVNMGSMCLKLKEILFIETDKRNIRIHTRMHDYICSDSISDIEEKLATCGFFRCHKSYIVNLDAIKEIDHLFVHMIDDSKAMVSTRKYAELRKKYLERKFEQANG